MSAAITFGPVPSRRLGRSLGINNIVAPKVCSYACVYCQVGKTAVHTLERQPFYGPEEIFNQVRNHLKRSDGEDQPDYLTFVANGEPTLDTNLGATIRRLKIFDIPIAVITNATLLHIPGVVQALLEADWVSVKVDAADETTWRRVNLPVKEINFALQLQSITAFARRFGGKLCTETMLVSGRNDAGHQLETTARFVASVKPAVAYLSVPTRPPAVKLTKAPDEEVLNHAWNLFNQAGINTELLTGFEGTTTGYTGNAETDILSITAVHPLRHDMLEELLHNDNAPAGTVEKLLDEGRIKAIEYNSHIFYLRSLKKNSKK